VTAAGPHRGFVMASERPDTRDPEYTRRLHRLDSRWWKRVFDVQAPYRRYLRRLDLGLTLDLGCGVGRNLRNLNGRGVGVDHNPDSISLARGDGFVAYTPDEFKASEHGQPARFESLLVAHVLEHMPRAEAVDLVRSYLEYIRPGGRVVMITPQERGFRSDPTHVEFVDFAALAEITRSLELEPVLRGSFPFPRAVGRVFPYNEFVAVVRHTTERQ
jgi:2-polyprenyl-3-methyl-5-hydroxy-6-metoxy-1,4-benzoquinol methylase